MASHSKTGKVINSDRILRLQPFCHKNKNCIICDLNEDIITVELDTIGVHDRVKAPGLFNFQKCQISVKSKLKPQGINAC